MKCVRKVKCVKPEAGIPTRAPLDFVYCVLAGQIEPAAKDGF